MKEENTNLVVVETYFDHLEADLNLARLSQSGIEAILANEELFLVNPAAENIEGIQLKVREEDMEKAKFILNEVKNDS